jgi:hypothetical protein
MAYPITIFLVVDPAVENWSNTRANVYYLDFYRDAPERSQQRGRNASQTFKGVTAGDVEACFPSFTIDIGGPQDADHWWFRCARQEEQGCSPTGWKKHRHACHMGVDAEAAVCDDYIANKVDSMPEEAREDNDGSIWCNNEQ